MSGQSHVVHGKQEPNHGSYRSYTVGYVLSIILTVVAYLVAVNANWSGWVIMIVLVTMAIMQLIVQLLFFLHLGRETKPKWNLAVFLYIASAVLIVVIGSIWIMYNLDYSHGHNHTGSEDTLHHTQEDEIIDHQEQH